MKVTVKLLNVSEIETGTNASGVNWERLTILTETFNPIPDKIAFQVWAKTIPQVHSLKIGQAVTINFNLQSKEHEGKFYHDVTAWKLEPLKN